MANDTMNKSNDSNNQTMKHEQAKASVSGERNEERSQTDQDRQNQNRDEKSAIGGGHKDGEMGQTKQSPTGQSGDYDKSRSEPTSR